MDKDNRNQQEVTPVEDSLNEISFSTIPIEFTELIREHAFLGKFSLIPIFEGIVDQFRDYINMEDKENYVDIFYTQLHASRIELLEDDWEEHPSSVKDVLDTIHRTFIDLMQKWFYQRLTISITDLEAEAYDEEDIEFIIRRLYEFFILDAQNNFKVVIGSGVQRAIKNWEDYTDEEYFPMVQKLTLEYSPLITTITPMEFLQIRGDKEIFELFDNGRVTGNFLRKYSPKFYHNEAFHSDVINYITSLVQPPRTAGVVVAVVKEEDSNV